MFHDRYDALIAIIEQRSLNRAAKYLNISQPALSRKLQKLEQALGVQLFQRSGKKLELTRVGQLCYERLIALQAIEQQMLQELRMYSDEQKSLITIGASLTTLQSTLPRLITGFTAVHAQHEIKVITGKTHEIVNFVREKKVDIGLIATTIEQQGMHCVPLFGDHLQLVVPHHHPFCNEQPSINELNQLPMILFSSGSLYRVLMDELFQRYGIFPQVKMEIDSFEAIIRLVATFRVATLLPKSYLHATMLEQNELTVIEVPELQNTIRETSLIYHNAMPLNHACQQFIRVSQRTYEQV